MLPSIYVPTNPKMSLSSIALCVFACFGEVTVLALSVWEELLFIVPIDFGYLGFPLHLPHIHPFVSCVLENRQCFFARALGTSKIIRQVKKHRSLLTFRSGPARNPGRTSDSNFPQNLGSVGQNLGSRAYIPRDKRPMVNFF